MKKKTLSDNKYVQEIQKSYRLFHALNNESIFNKLTIKEKLEALRIGVTQR